MKPFFVCFPGHHVPSVQSRLRTISNLTRKLSLSNSRIIENPSRRLSASSSTSRLNNNGIGKTLVFFVKRQKADVVINFCVCFVHFQSLSNLHTKSDISKKVREQRRELERCLRETCKKMPQPKNYLACPTLALSRQWDYK